jgi:hypothetical protein
MRHSIRSATTGKFIKKNQPSTIVAGRLYGYRGAVVRAGNDTIKRNGEAPQRHVNFHKALFGFVPENELTKVDKNAVEAYLNCANA